MASYCVNFKNESHFAGDVCLFQPFPASEIPKAVSLAWLSEPTQPGETASFEWEYQHDFFWSELSALQPGSILKVGGILPADISEKNQVEFAFENNSFLFRDQQKGKVPGRLDIHMDESIPWNRSSVGICMSGYPIYAAQAQPGYQYNFTFHPQYFLTYGDYKQGQILDLKNLPVKTEFTFPKATYSLNITLKEIIEIQEERS